MSFELRYKSHSHSLLQNCAWSASWLQRARNDISVQQSWGWARFWQMSCSRSTTWCSSTWRLKVLLQRIWLRWAMCMSALNRWTTEPKLFCPPIVSRLALTWHALPAIPIWLRHFKLYPCSSKLHVSTINLPHAMVSSVTSTEPLFLTVKIATH